MCFQNGSFMSSFNVPLVFTFFWLDEDVFYNICDSSHEIGWFFNATQCYNDTDNEDELDNETTAQIPNEIDISERQSQSDMSKR